MTNKTPERLIFDKAKVGDKLVFDVPTRQPKRRNTVRKLNAYAYAAWGAGNYTIKTEKNTTTFHFHRGDEVWL